MSANPTLQTRAPNIFTLFRPWTIWALGSSFLFYKYLLQVSPSVMTNELMHTFSLNGVQLGNLAAFYFYAYLCMQIPVGMLLDRFGARRLVSIAILTCALGAFLFSQARTLPEAYLGRLLIGVGGSFSAVGTMKLITVWFPPKRFALLAGLMMTVGMLGAVGGEAPLAALTDHLGWRETIFISACAGIFLAGLFFIASKGKGLFSPATKETQGTFYEGFRRILANPQSWLVSLYSGLAFAPISAFAGLWGVPYLTESYHLPRTTMAGIVSLTFIGFAAGSPFSGWFSDYIAKRKPVMAFGTFMGLICLLTILYTSNLPLILLGALLFFFGFFASFFFVSFALMREISPLFAAGTAIGFINMFNAMGGALSEPLIGKLLDMGWHGVVFHGIHWFSVQDYHHALIALPVAMVVALILIFFIKEREEASR